jgi:hypothetical protein
VAAHARTGLEAPEAIRLGRGGVDDLPDVDIDPFGEADGRWKPDVTKPMMPTLARAQCTDEAAEDLATATAAAGRAA